MTVKRELTIGDLLKSEADPNSRITIKEGGIKAGEFVDHPLRKEPLIALSDSENGEVLVQPHNCVINLSAIPEDNITNHTFGDDSTPLTLELLKAQGDKYGIKYIGHPHN